MSDETTLQDDKLETIVARKDSMRKFSRILATACVLITSFRALAQQPKPAAAGLPGEATVNDFLKHMFGWNQNLAWRVAEIKPSDAPGISQVTVVFNTPDGQAVQKIYVTADEHYAFSGELVPFGSDPFAAARADLKAANGPVHGPADAVVTVVEFGDLQCPACKKAQENLNKLMGEEPKAKLIFQNFPLVQIHKWAMLGAKYVDCFGRQNNAAVWKFIAITYDHQSEVNEQNVEQMLNGYVKEAGGDPDAVSACAAKPETEKRVRDSLALGEKLEVTSTPTFFINGRKVSGFLSMPYESVKAMVDYEVK
jgi:protein-disulfide isomerase